MKTLKARFNHVARRQAEANIFLLWQSLSMLISRQRRLESELAQFMRELRGNRPGS